MTAFPLVELKVAAIREASAELSQHSDLYPEFARVFEPEKATLGRVVQQPELQKRSRRSRAREAPYLYGGQLGSAVVKAANRSGGCFTEQDLSSYRPGWQEPLRVSSTRAWNLF
ncbi:gamma-glutamyltransferase [Bradyrhizobium genosp. P]|uniref:gamma-glutamyltransferase n=1 Tax=Bradyrhizobium genosp. P TaxID=83641 RepID=UPI003CF66DE3